MLARPVMGTIFLVYIYSILHILTIVFPDTRTVEYQWCSIEISSDIYTRIMVTIKKRAGVIPYSFSSSTALLSSLLSCSFYLLDPRTISRVDILEMT